MPRRASRNIQRRSKRNDEFAAFGDAVAAADRERQEAAFTYAHEVEDLANIVDNTKSCWDQKKTTINRLVRNGERSRAAIARELELGAVLLCDVQHPPRRSRAVRRGAAAALVRDYDWEEFHPGIVLKPNSARHRRAKTNSHTVPKLDSETYSVPGGLKVRIEQQATGTQWRHVWIFAPIPLTDDDEMKRYLRIALARRIATDLARRVAAPGGTVEVIDVQNGGAVQWAADRHIVRHLTNRQIASLVASIARALIAPGPKANRHRPKARSRR